MRSDYDLVRQSQAEYTGWVCISQVKQSIKVPVHHWWTHTGVCPRCRPRVAPHVLKNRIPFIVAIVAAVITLCITALATAGPPPPVGVGSGGQITVFFVLAAIFLTLMVFAISDAARVWWYAKKERRDR